jgi:predicted dehydrogenase
MRPGDWEDEMSSAVDRRKFLKTASAALGVTAAVPTAVAGAAPAIRRQAGSPNERVRVAVMGVNSRGHQLTRAFASDQTCAVTVICDVDSRAAARARETVVEAGGPAPQLIGDVRRVLESRDVDALVIAAPDHWHAPAAIMACHAGKHVYVEKPCSHNPREGEVLVAVANSTGRVVQMGNQRRSWPNVQEGIAEVHAGRVGRVYLARTWYANTRGSMGKGKPMDVPEWLDYELWQGPAPRRPLVDNIIHYDWHWRWHWGTGESANNGTHMFDLARWGLQVEHPTRVMSAGGRFQYDDDWEFPDTQTVTLEYPGQKMITWESMSSNGWRQEGRGVGVTFHGDKGTLFIDGNGYQVFDPAGNMVREVKAPAPSTLTTAGPGRSLDAGHAFNFLEAIRGRQTLAADIAGGHTSTMMAHLSNIAWKTGRVLSCDPQTGRVLNDPEAMTMWSREYEPGWEPRT